MEGTLIGGVYRVGEKVGGTGRVSTHTATDDAGSRYVITFVWPRDDADLRALESRASLASSLEHEDIARVLDWGTADEQFYVVREYVQGEDLLSLLARRGKLDWVTAARYMTFACAALGAATHRGLVHGSLRPERLVLTPEGTVKVTGFELSHELAIGDVGPESPPEQAYYLSPEQATGHEPNPGSDVYSVGIILYQLVTGTVPFDAPNAAIVAHEQATAEPEPPRRVVADIPASIESVIMTSLRKDPSARGGGPGDLLGRLDQLIGGPVGISAQPPRRRRMWPWALVAIVLIAAAAAFLILRSSGNPVPDLSGMTTTEATKALKATGFTIGGVSYDAAATATASPGTVIRQTPPAGQRQPSGSAVDVVVAGAETVSVPDVTGIDETQAYGRIQNAGLTLGKVTRAPDAKVPLGQIVSQTPSGGLSVPKGSPVDLTVSTGAPVTTVPSVTGMIEQTAVNTLEGAGYKVSTTRGYSSTIASGAVISQTPVAGVSLATGSTVQIVVSRGVKPVQQVRVPALVGLTQVAANSELTALGLVPASITQSDPANVGKVIVQSPLSGTMVASGSTVTITIGIP
jgi:beta-lactam-binding protein with PASTA domain